jgi:hypothetical protein
VALKITEFLLNVKYNVWIVQRYGNVSVNRRSLHMYIYIRVSYKTSASDESIFELTVMDDENLHKN